MITHEVEYENLKLEVTGTYYSGLLGDLETPPEPEEFEIELVTLNGVDITELLQNSYNYVEPKNRNKPFSFTTKLDDIESLILENNYR